LPPFSGKHVHRSVFIFKKSSFKSAACDTPDFARRLLENEKFARRYNNFLRRLVWFF